MNVFDLLTEKGLVPKRKGASSQRGVEFASPCPRPGCCETDGFLVWPEQNHGKGSWWCRGCEKGGDAISFLMHFDGLTYPQACDKLGVEVPMVQTSPTPSRPSKKPFEPKVYRTPADLWQQKAKKFVDHCHDQLVNHHAGQLAALLNRGITRRSVEKYQLGWNADQKYFRPRSSWGLEKEFKKAGVEKKLWVPRGMVIPYKVGDQVRRVRIRRPKRDLSRERDQRYFIVPGSQMTPWLSAPQRKAYVVVETELDGILIDQEAGDLVGFLALGTSRIDLDAQSHQAITKAMCVLVALDFDKAGSKGWQWWKQNYANATLCPVPVGKDPGEAYQAGVPLKRWLKLALPPYWMVGGIEKPNRKEPGGDSKPSKLPEIELQKPVGILDEVAAMLKKYPVTIFNSPTRTHIVADKIWSRRHEQESRELYNLIFLNEIVLSHVLNHPASKIDGSNFIET